MTTFEPLAEFHSPAVTPAAGKPDFVSSDAAALASHMNRCASSRSRFFGLQSGLESAHSLVSPRIVTVAAFAIVFLGLVSIA